MQSVKKKLLISFLFIIAILQISNGFFVAMDEMILNKYRNIARNIIGEFTLTKNSAELVFSFNKRIKSPSDRAEASNFNSLYAETENLLTSLRGSIVNSSSQVIFNGIESNVNDILFNLKNGVVNLENNDYLAAVDSYDAANRKTSFVQENVAKLLEEELTYASSLQKELDNVKNISNLISIFLFIMATGGCIWYALYFSKKIVAPLTELTSLAKEIESGDLNASVNKSLLEGRDEIASLANSFNTMVFFLRSNIKKLQEYNLEIKKSRNYLKAEKQKLQQYLDVAGVIVLIFDVNGNVMLVNKKGREILNIAASEIMGKDWVDLFVKKSDKIKTRSMLNFLVGDIAPVDTIENILISKDKQEKNIVWHFSILRNENNAPQAILGTGVDVTELAAAKVTINQLKEVDRLKNEVLNIATHELKTPLISIVGLSEIMEKQPKTVPDDYQKFISLIHTEGLKLTNLIKTMLTASRNEIGKTAVNIEKFVFDELILSMKTSLGVLTKRTDSQVAFDIQATGINMESDKLKISQVVYNFVDNAVKYGIKNQTITVSVTKPDEQSVRLAVTGAGQGIAKEKQKSLFLKFSQLEPSLSRSQDGMGLGLYICKQNIESLGGEIGVISEVNQGATFFFILPLIYKAPLSPTEALAAQLSTKPAASAAVAKSPASTKSPAIAKPAASAPAAKPATETKAKSKEIVKKK